VDLELLFPCMLLLVMLLLLLLDDDDVCPVTDAVAVAVVAVPRLRALKREAGDGGGETTIMDTRR